MGLLIYLQMIVKQGFIVYLDLNDKFLRALLLEECVFQVKFVQQLQQQLFLVLLGHIVKTTYKLL